MMRGDDVSGTPNYPPIIVGGTQAAEDHDEIETEAEAQEREAKVIRKYSVGEEQEDEPLPSVTVLSGKIRLTALGMVKVLRDAAANTPALDSSDEWTRLIELADEMLARHAREG